MRCFFGSLMSTQKVKRAVMVARTGTVDGQTNKAEDMGGSLADGADGSGQDYAFAATGFMMSRLPHAQCMELIADTNAGVDLSHLFEFARFNSSPFVLQV